MQQDKIHSGTAPFLIVLLLLITIQFNISAQEVEGAGGWFFFDRAMPYDTIPSTAYKKAVDDQWEMRQNNGYDLSPQVSIWTSIGPGNDNTTGRVVRVKYDPTNDNIVYICGHNGGVWRSDNAQANPPSIVSFDFKTKDLQTQSSGDIAIDPQDPNTIYYGTGGNVFCFLYNFYGLGVYKSTNKGNDWTGPYSNGLPSLIFTSTIAVNPVTRDVYLANGYGAGPYGTGVGGGLYKSIDGGVNWAKVTAGNAPCFDVVFSNNGQYVYAVTNAGYWRSLDYGVNFSLVDPESGLSINGRTQIAISPINNNYVYVVTAKTSGPGQYDQHNLAYVSTDGGQSFTLPGVDLGPNNCMSYDFIFIQASPFNPLEAYIGFGSNGSDCFFRTTDGGQSYQHIFPNGAGGDVSDLNNFAFNPNNTNQGLLCNDRGLFISNNIQAAPGSVTFTSLNNTLSLRENYRVATNPNDDQDMVLAMEDAGLYKYSGGVIWSETNGGCDGTSVIHSRSGTPDVFLATKGIDALCTGYNGTITSTNGGSAWQYHPSLPWSYWDSNLDWIGVFAEKPDVTGTFYHPRRNGSNKSLIDVNVTVNYGASWIPPSQNPITQIPTGNDSYVPTSMAVCDANPQIMYVSTKRWLDNPPPLSQVWVTTNGGQVWQNRYITLHGVPNRVVTNIVADPINQNIVYLTLSGFNNDATGDIGHVFKSNNKGLTWANISNWPYSAINFLNLPVNHIIVRQLGNTQRQLIIATDAGVYTTTDGDSPPHYVYNWRELATGLPNTVCLGLDYNRSSNKLRAALFGRGIWEVPLGGGINIADNQIFGNSPITNELNIGDDIIVSSGGTLNIPTGCTVKMAAGKKIIVQDGGQIDCSSGNAITFTSQNGTWGGIEFQGSGAGTLSNCTFTNTETPITIDGTGGSEGPTGAPLIYVYNCTINGGSVSVTGRNNVTISKCNINGASNSTGTGISVVYGNNITLNQNNIHNAMLGISVSNSSPALLYNTIDNNAPQNAYYGISMNNSYSSTLSHNNVTGYMNGVYLFYSYPTMLANTVVNDNTFTNDSIPASALFAKYMSSAKLMPSAGDAPGTVVWDAGQNILRSNSIGSGIYIYNLSEPAIDYGHNTIYGREYSIDG